MGAPGRPTPHFTASQGRQVEPKSALVVLTFTNGVKVIAVSFDLEGDVRFKGRAQSLAHPEHVVVMTHKKVRADYPVALKAFMDGKR